MEACIRKIVWSVDAFEEGSGVQEHTAETLRNFIRGTAARVEPVYALSPEQLNVGAGGLESSLPWIEQYRPAAEKSLREKIQRYQFEGMDPPQVIVQAASSTSSAVRALAGYAANVGADMIAVGTHARTGMPRFFLGSFAESLLMHSRIPVLVVNPKTQVVEKYQEILFPTDLGLASRALFKRVLLLARDLKAKLTVYHCVRNPIEPVLESGIYLMGGGWIPAADYLEDEVKKRQKQLERWVRIAEKAQVPVEVVVETARKGVVASILDLAEQRGVGLIAMAAQSGPVASMFIGSVTRQLVREASVPVWVMRATRQRAR